MLSHFRSSWNFSLLTKGSCWVCREYSRGTWNVSERVLSLVFCKKNGKCKIHEQNEVAYDGQFLALYVVFPVYFLKSRKCFHIFFLFTSCYGNDILPLYAYFYCISLDLIIISITNSEIRMIRGFLHKIFMIISLGKRRNKRSEEYVLF